MKRSLTRLITFASVLLSVLVAVEVCAQTREASSATGLIAGRITLGGRPLPGITVTVQPQSSSGFTPGFSDVNEAWRAMTDEEGRYRIAGLTAGRYQVLPLAPAFVVPSENRLGPPGKQVTVAENESVEDIDFALTRGGVITGRVTDGGGQPVIDERIILTRDDERGQRRLGPAGMISVAQTDDRGVYRLYGLAAGRYLVSVGQVGGVEGVRIGGDRHYYPRTFHPNTTDESQAKVVEVKEGDEVTGVDIAVGRVAKAYDVIGRVVQAESGQPVPFVMVGYSATSTSGGGARSSSAAGPRTNAQGEFRIEGVLPGKYTVLMADRGETGFYGDPVEIEVVESDITNLQILVRSAGSISGVAVIEGTNDPAAVSKLSQLRLTALSGSGATGMLTSSSHQINADGTFRISGVRPGKVRISISLISGSISGGGATIRIGPSLSVGGEAVDGLTLVRIERDGVPQGDGIEVGPGEQVSNVRLVFRYNTGILRGQLRVVGGALPEGMSIAVNARSAGSSPMSSAQSAQVGARGQFVIRGLAPGEYEVVAVAIPRGAVPPELVRQIRQQLIQAKQLVTVTEGTEAQITLVVDLSRRENQQ